MNKLVLSTLSVAAMGMVFFSGGTAYAYAMEETEVSKIQIGNPQGDKKAGAYQTTLTFTAAFK
ncbi:hypothetical protein C9846_00015 [Listeria monocytogenes]|nr:hypothetical protein [Listeria monocytogenes]PXD34712.1 hypothetical protein C9846_00015 [Listeria monocytogenes]